MFSSLHQGLWVWFGAAWTRFVCEVQLQRLVCLRRVSAGMSLWPVTPRVFAYNLFWGWQMFWKKTCEFRIAITTIHLKVFWIFYIFYKSWNVLLTPNDFCIKFYFTFNITIIAQSFKIRLWILFLASLKINDWLIKKKILLVETIEKMNICLSMHQETGGNVQWILRYSYWFFINIYRYKLQLT